MSQFMTAVTIIPDYVMVTSRGLPQPSDPNFGSSLSKIVLSRFQGGRKKTRNCPPNQTPTTTYQNGQPVVVEDWGFEPGIFSGDSPREEEKGQDANSSYHQELPKKQQQICDFIQDYDSVLRRRERWNGDHIFLLPWPGCLRDSVVPTWLPDNIPHQEIEGVFGWYTKVLSINGNLKWRGIFFN